MFLRPPAHAPTVHVLQDRFFSRRPNGRLRLAQEETPSLVTEEVANDSSSKPIRVLPNTYLLLLVVMTFGRSRTEPTKCPTTDPVKSP